ncbi:MAG: winged helix-turn-helix transcriptional regulator [Thaumarchaeota archaeon]|nr:winged helix-turn-helix transcriptional regulator [Nitrososphaerota archaeon]
MALRELSSLPEDVEEVGESLEEPTDLEGSILDELSKSKLTPSDLADRLDKKAPSIVRALSSMFKKGWVTRVGQGRRAYYSITQKGEAARRLQAGQLTSK